MLKLVFVVLLVGLFACTYVEDKSPVLIESTSRQDGPPADERDLSTIKDAEPKPVKRTRAGNKSPYTVFGKTYYLLKESAGYKEQGGASWYGSKFHGRRTSNGEVYDMWAMTAAHKTLPIPSYVRVTNLQNKRSVVVRINDRGPFHADRIIDLSYAAASKLGFAKQGTAQVEVVDITPEPEVFSVPSSVSSSRIPLNSTPSKQSTVSGTENKTSTSEVFVEKTFQVAAFRNQQKAVELQARLSQKLAVPVKVEVDKTGTWYRVRVGPIRDVAQLEQTKQSLLEQGISTSLPVLK